MQLEFYIFFLSLLQILKLKISMPNTFFRIIFILFSAVIVSSCITTHQTNYLQPAKNFIPAYKDTASYEDYKLKTGDRLFVQVYSMDEKTNSLFNGTNNGNSQNLSNSGESSDLYSYLIQQDGTIHFPIVGDIIVVGKTLRQTKFAIEDAIRPILKINSVDVRMVGRSFSIIGAGKSGKFSFPNEKVNIFQALAMAGDLGLYADRSKIKILRETAHGTEIKMFDLRSVDIINSEYYFLEPNDVIFIQPMNQQFFGVTTLWSAISAIISSVSFGVGVYYLFFPKPTVK
jgi:polysaccharide export outer membrane protein